MSLETRLRNTGQQGGVSSGSASSSAGLAGTDGLFVVTSASPLFPNSRILSAGSSVTIVTDSTRVYITALTPGAGVTAAAGSNGWVQFNSQNALAANSGLIWDNTGFTLTVSGGTGGLVTAYQISAGVLRLATSLAVDYGGTGAATFGSGLVYSASGGTNALQTVSVTTAFGLLGINSNNATLEFKNLVAGNNVTFTYQKTGITIAATTGAAASTRPGTYNLLPQQAKLYANTSAARIDAGTPTWRLLFSPTTQQYGVWQLMVPAEYNFNPYFRIAFSSDSSLAVAKSVTWSIEQWGMQFGQSGANGIYADTFGGANTFSLALSAGYSSGTLMMLTIPLATTISLNASRLVSFRVSSSAGNVTGNQELTGLTFEYDKL